MGLTYDETKISPEEEFPIPLDADQNLTKTSRRKLVHKQLIHAKINDIDQSINKLIRIRKLEMSAPLYFFVFTTEKVQQSEDYSKTLYQLLVTEPFESTLIDASHHRNTVLVITLSSSSIFFLNRF